MSQSQAWALKNLPNLIQYASINRAVLQMLTGMEKEKRWRWVG
uniref:Uncharacterized protein n=1 Tax=Anolis carolinensis TaxID=28377 RepID=A0A803TFH3_ANOCA